MTVLTVGRGASSDLRWSLDDLSFPDFRALEGVDAVVHLAGENVSRWFCPPSVTDRGQVASGAGPLAFLGRWSPAKKQAILESRVNGTRLIVDSIQRLQTKPKVFVSASGVGFYGFEGDELRDESSQVGDGFLAYVCQQWEGEALKAERVSGMRTVVARIAVVLR